MSSELFARLEAESEAASLAQQEGRDALYDQPVAARVAAGLAVDGLACLGLERRPDAGEVLVLAGARNDSRLRPGTRGRLSRGDPRRPAAKVEILDDSFDGGRFVFKVSVLSKEEGEDFASTEPWVLDEDHFDLLDLELAMLRRARNEGLGAWLDGSEPVERAAMGAGLGASPYAKGLSGSLAEAFGAASAARRWHAVQGPPGTGKTFLLARLAVDAAARQGLRVLVTAVSHQAIHNALSQCYWLAAEAQHTDAAARELARAGFYKLGSSKALLSGLPVGVRGARRLPKRRALVAGATMYSIYSGMVGGGGDSGGDRPLSRRNMGPVPGRDVGPVPAEDDQRFDLVLFDEAGQARLPLALGARACAGKAVFIGDDRQLPPVVAGPQGRQPVSVLSMVRERYGAPLMLTETRRLNEGLCAAVSETFYEGKLEPTPDARARRLSLERSPRPAFAGALDPASPLVFLDVPHEGCRSVSEAEARWAAALAAEAMRCGVPPGEIGVVSPFRAQCNRIRFLLHEAAPAGGRAEDVLVATVERFQGQEREVIVLSLAASQPSYVGALSAFLFSANRLNVAVSRARTKAVVLGAHGLLRRFAEEAGPDGGAAEGCAAYLRLRALAARARAEGEPPGVLVEGPAASIAPASAGTAGLGPARPAAPGFAVGDVLEHADFGVGIVVGEARAAVGHQTEPALEIRFADGRTRVVVPRLCPRPLRLVTRGGA